MSDTPSPTRREKYSGHVGRNLNDTQEDCSITKNRKQLFCPMLRASPSSNTNIVYSIALSFRKYLRSIRSIAGLKRDRFCNGVTVSYSRVGEYDNNQRDYRSPFSRAASIRQRPVAPRTHQWESVQPSSRLLMMGRIP